MTKAPFASVAWLSQSSRAPKEPREEPPEAQRVEPCAQGMPSGRKGPPLGQGTPPQEQQQLPPSPPKAFLGRSAPSSAALASPEGEWVSSEGGSDGEGVPPEGGPPAGKSSSSSSSSNSPRRRLRTAFSLDQISTLESAFQRQRYLGAAQRRKLATKMHLSEVQIKTWFQNRRMKLKRQMQEMQSEVYPSIPFYRPLPFGSPSGSGPLSYVYSPRQQTVSKREDPIPLGLPFPPLPAPSMDPRSPSTGHPGALWPMPLPCLVGYQDPRTVFMTL